MDDLTVREYLRDLVIKSWGIRQDGGLGIILDGRPLIAKVLTLPDLDLMMKVRIPKGKGCPVEIMVELVDLSTPPPFIGVVAVK